MPSETPNLQEIADDLEAQIHECCDSDDGDAVCHRCGVRMNAVDALHAAHQERDADARRLAKLREKLERIALCDRPVDYSDRAHRCTWRVQAERAAQIARDSLALRWQRTHRLRERAMGHLTSGSVERGGGLERYVFEVDARGIAAMAERAAGSIAVRNQILVGWYLQSPRPDPRDILDVLIAPGSEAGMMRVTLTVLRGHYRLAAFVREHRPVMISEDGVMRCGCHPGHVEWLVEASLPGYGGWSEAPGEES